MVKRLFNWPVYLLVFTFFGGFLAYEQWLSPTRVALVNFRDFQVARFDKANDSESILISELGPDQLDQVDNYDLTLIFGRGFALDGRQLQLLQDGIADGALVFVEAATNPRLDLTNVPQPHLDNIKAYLDNGGTANYRNFLRLVRHQLDGKTWGSEPPGELMTVDSDVLFHIDESQLFTEVEDYAKYYQTLPNFPAQGKKIALLTSVPGPFNANREHLDALITSLEARGLQVYPVASRSRRLELLKTIAPDAVIMMPHGRLHLGRGDKAVEWLKEQQVPLLAPLSVFDDHERWLQDPQGYSGAMLTMNVVLPELDGAVAPYVINAQFPDENGYLIFEAVPQRLQVFLDLLEKFLALKTKTNADKKIGIVYFRGPGKNALVAGGMEVAPSLFNTLHTLKKQGYQLGNLPDDFESFNQQLNRQGVILAPFAEGSIEEFMKQGDPALVPGAVYQQWCEGLADALCSAMVDAYGPAPGQYMVTEDNELAVARLQYGNVVLLPQPLPGLGEDTFQLVHGTDKAPPHNYAAAYLWLRHSFAADAVMHYGTHGSLEFTPAKQVALSANDWADAMLGGIPHFYVYTMANVGEAIIAKRRSYATILNHLTPPFQEAGLYSEWKTLADKVAEYQLAAEGAVRSQLQKQIASVLQKEGLYEDLSLQPGQLNDTAQWDERVLDPLTRWLETLGQEKILEGLYTLGVPYQGEQARRTTRLMSVDALAQAMLSVQQIIQAPQAPETVTPALREQAELWISRRLAGESAQQLLSTLLPGEIAERVARWQQGNPVLNDMDIIRGFMDMAAAGKQKKHTKDAAAAKNILNEESLMALTAQVISDPDSKAFIASMKGQQRFEHVSRALDPQSAKTAKMLAKVIPSIGEALAMLEKDNVRQLVEAMQNPQVRSQVFAWIDNGGLAEQVAAAKQRRLQQLHAQAQASLPVIAAHLSSQTQDMDDWQALEKNYRQLLQYRERFVDDKEVIALLSPQLESQYQMNTRVFAEKLSLRIDAVEGLLAKAMQREQTLADAYTHFANTLAQVQDFERHLLKGSEYEQAAMVNALAGGYVEPASGGDPIVNPQALPTGRNMYAIDAEKTPTEAAWKVGQQMAQALLESHRQQFEKYPEKVSFTLWPNSFIQSQGATVAQILYLLGVEPVRDAFGRVQTLRLIPAAKLDRPRVDVVMQSAGQFRDLAASRLALIEKAVVMAAEAAKSEQGENFVAKGVRDAEQHLLERGVAPLRARTLAAKRSFGGLNGAYGTAIMSMVEGDTRWRDGDDIARQYLKNMGANYGGGEGWGEYEPDLFAAALLNTEVVIQPRSSNTWGALSLDHVYEFMGGLNNAVRHVTGNDPAAYFNDFRDPGRAKVTSFHETLWAEMRTTLLNPRYISALQKGSSSSAETFAETFRNSFGWNVMKPEGMDDRFWNSLYEVYIEDKNGLKIQAFFERENPYALQEMTGVMLETARRGYWQASELQLTELASLHAELVSEFELGGGDFSGGNMELAAFVAERLPENLKQNFQQEIEKLRGASASQRGVVLEKQDAQQVQQDTQQTETVEAPENAEPQTPDGTPLVSTLLWPLFFLLLVLAAVWGWRRARI